MGAARGGGWRVPYIRLAVGDASHGRTHAPLCVALSYYLIWGPRTVSALPPKPVTVSAPHACLILKQPALTTPPARTQVGGGGNRDSDCIRDAYSELVENKLLEVP